MATAGLGRLPVVENWRAGGRTTPVRWVTVVEEGQLEGGTRTLIGGFDETAVGWNPEMEGLDGGDGRRMDLAGFFMRFEAAAVDLISERSGLGSEGSRVATYETNLATVKQRLGW